MTNEPIGTEALVCKVCRKRARDCQCRGGTPFVRPEELPPLPEERRYDVNASVCDLDTLEGVDGAYALICRNATADEIAAKLRELLSGEWGYSEGDGPLKPAALSIHIGPAGSSDNLPL